MTILTYIIIVLGVFTLVQIARVFELVDKIKGNKHTIVSDYENTTQSFMWVLFVIGYFSFFIWLVYTYSPYLLTKSASIHGENIDMILNFNLIIITTAFTITHILLVIFVVKYSGRKNRKSTFVTHNNKLEFVWTIIPSIALAIIVIYGLTAWNEITDDAPENALKIEIYGKQFNWTARYCGADNEIGDANYLFINGTNPIGIITTNTIKTRLSELSEEILKLKEKLNQTKKIFLPEVREKLDWKKRQLKKIQSFEKRNAKTPFQFGNDDKIVNEEFHIPVGKPVNFTFRSQDVIHSAYMPHFRAQMNVLPGMITEFHFTPTITTKEMKKNTGNKNFEYILLCNKICGAAHYNMQMKIIVDTQEDYENWISQQKTFE